MKNEEDEVKL